MINTATKTVHSLRMSLRSRGICLRTFADTGSLSLGSSKTGGDVEPPKYAPDAGSSGMWKKPDGVKLSDQNNRPMIFLWMRDKPASGTGVFVRLPDCDVVYREEIAEKRPRRQQQSPTYHCLSSPKMENEIVKRYLGGNETLEKSSSIFCVYNPGDSTLPQRLLEAKADRVVILDAPKSGYLTKWQKFASDNNSGQKIFVRPYDFNRLATTRVRDFHQNKGLDSLCQIFADAGATAIGPDGGRSWWENEDPAIRICGVADPFKEHVLFATLLYTRITRSSIYEFGPVEFIVAVSAQQYLDFHDVAAQEKPVSDGVPKLVRWRARLYHYLFKIDFLAYEPFGAFSPKISKRKMKFETSRASKTVYDQLEIDQDNMYWLAVRPDKRCDVLEALCSRDYGEHECSDVDSSAELERRRNFPHLAGFAYMYRILSRQRADTLICDFIKNYFPEVDVRHTIDSSMTADKGVRAATLDDLLNIYTTLALHGGAMFYNSPFFNEAQEFVEKILCPTVVEPKMERIGKRKIVT